MRLTLEKLRHAFLETGCDKFRLSTAWVLINHAEKHGDVDLSEALTLVRSEKHEISIFVDHILQSSDSDDVDYVLELLSADIRHGYSWAPECWSMLQAWRARTNMRIVIDKRNAMNRAVGEREKGIV